MSPDCARIQADAAGLAALPRGDAEREAAWRHAEGCAECRRALEQGDKLHALLGSVASPPPPSPGILARAQGEIVRDLVRRALALTTAAATVLAWTLLVAFSRRRGTDVTAWLVSLGAGLAAVVVALAAVRHAGGAMVVAAALSAGMVLIAGSDGPLEAAIGVHCLAAELVAAALVVGAVAALLLPRGAGVAAQGARLAAIAAAGALAAQAALYLGCRARTAAPHLWMFHAGGVLAAAALGAAVARLRGFRSLPPPAAGAGV
jgi:hypothetical protein